MEITDNEKGCCNGNKKCHCKGTYPSDAVYGMGLIGSLIYFLQDVHGFGNILLGIGKAIAWPAFLIFKLLSFLQL